MCLGRADVNVARLAAGRWGGVQSIEGSPDVHGQKLSAEVRIEGPTDAHFLFFDVN